MTTALLLTILLSCQIVLVSIRFPRRVVIAIQGAVSGRTEPDDVRGVALKRYLLLNYAVAASGLVGLVGLVVCVVLHYGGFLSMVGLLLAIGVVFLAQVSPLAVLFRHGIIFTEQHSDERKFEFDSGGAVPGLLELLPRVPVLTAVGLFLAYLAGIGTLWFRTGVNQLPKIVSVTFTNLVCAGAVLWAYRRLLHEADDRVNRYKELMRMGPLLIFASILVTIYFFAKEVLFAFELYEARPIMMSVALQVVAAIVFGAISEVTRSRTTA